MQNTSDESELASVHSSASVTCLFLHGSGPNYNRARHGMELERESISRGRFPDPLIIQGMTCSWDNGGTQTLTGSL